MNSYQIAARKRRQLLDAGRRLWLNDDEDVATAPHEAAHALTARLLNLDPQSVTITPGYGFAGLTTFRRPSKKADPELAFKHIIVLMAGNEGERLAGAAADCGSNDLSQARDFAGLFCWSEAEIDIVIECARTSARDLIKANMGPWIALTAALLERRTLDANEIAEIMDANDNDDDDEDDAQTIFEDAISIRMPERGQLQFRLGSIV